jgi:asparagine synthase (glutamine-hydrolysing)
MTDPNPRGNQPMTRNQHVISLNGEIYNYEELRDVFLSSESLISNSDTEVLLMLFKNVGSRCFSLLKGMCACVIFDKNNKELTLFRDKLGKKPLYVRMENQRVSYASLPGCLLEENLPLTISSQFLYHYLRLGFGVDPITPYLGVKALPPGTIRSIRIDEQQFMIHERRVDESVRPSLPIESKTKSSKKIRELIFGAVYSRVKGHDNIALSLSGGVDSTILAISLREIGIDCTAFSVEWPDSDKYRYNFDAQIAEENANKLGHKFEKVSTFNASKLQVYLDRYLQIMQEPNSNSTGLSQIDLYSKISEKGFRLALTGDGADEIFAGYERYTKASPIAGVARFLPSSLFGGSENNFLRKILATSLNTFADWAYWHEMFSEREIDQRFNFKDETIREANSILHEAFDQYTKSSRGRVLDQFMSYDRGFWLTMESNRRLDRVSMEFSVEARSPFQDDDLFAFLKNLNLRKRDYEGKKLLFSAFPELNQLRLQDKKIGFISPIGHWLRCNKEFVRARIRFLDELEVWRPISLIDLEESFSSGNLKKLQQIWTLVVLSRWIENHNKQIILK